MAFNSAGGIVAVPSLAAFQNPPQSQPQTGAQQTLPNTQPRQLNWPDGWQRLGPGKPRFLPIGPGRTVHLSGHSWIELNVDFGALSGNPKYNGLTTELHMTPFGADYDGVWHTYNIAPGGSTWYPSVPISVEAASDDSGRLMLMHWSKLEANREKGTASGWNLIYNCQVPVALYYDLRVTPPHNSNRNPVRNPFIYFGQQPNVKKRLKEIQTEQLYQLLPPTGVTPTRPILP